MKKSIKVLAFTTAITGICAGTALAATIGNGTTVDENNVSTINSTARKIATERIAVSGLTIPNDTQIFYTSTASFVPNDVITFTFNNVAFTDGTFVLCNGANAVADYIGNVDTTNGVSNLVFRANQGMTEGNAGSIFYIANTCDNYTPGLDANGNPLPTADSALTPKFPALAAGANATVSAGAVFGTGTVIPGATANAATIYTVANQYSIEAPALTSTTINFESNLTTFTPSTNGTTLPTITGNTITVTSANVDVPATFVAGDKLTLTVNGPMSGVSRICFGDTACAADSAKKLTINTTAGTATGDVALFANNAPVLPTGALTFVFDGTTGLSARTYTVNAKLDFASTSELDRNLLTDVKYLALTLNSTQYYVPLVKFNTNSDTFIKLQSKNTSTGTNGVSIQCLATDGTMVPLTLTGDLAAIKPGTAYVIQGSQMSALVSAAGKAVDQNGFAAIITINTPNADTFAYAKLVDPNGTTRVPVKTVYEAGAAQIVE